MDRVQMGETEMAMCDAVEEDVYLGMSRIRNGRGNKFVRWWRENVEGVKSEMGFSGHVSKKGSKAVKKRMNDMWAEKCKEELEGVESRYSEEMECESLQEMGLLQGTGDVKGRKGEGCMR